jgi:dienelactone hydrolase
MKTPEWLKPGLQGAAVGAVALAIVGFSWGGWVTGGTAEKMASEQARLEVVAALVPICMEQSSQDPQVVATLAQLKDTSYYQRSDMLMKAGWATMPGSSDPNRDVARACMEKLAAQF